MQTYLKIFRRFASLVTERRLRLTDEWRARCGESRTPGSEGGVWKRPLIFGCTPSGLAAIRPLPRRGNAPCPYLTQGGGRTASTKPDLNQVPVLRRQVIDPALREVRWSSLPSPA